MRWADKSSLTNMLKFKYQQVQIRSTVGYKNNAEIQEHKKLALGLWFIKGKLRYT